MEIEPPIFDRLALVAAIKAKAVGLGFDLVGIAPAGPSRYADYLRRWLDAGRHGEMAYLADRFAERADPAVYFPGVRTAVCVAVGYRTSLEDPPAEGSHGRVARYALGDDYHDRIKPRLYDLADWLRETVPGCQTRCGVDTVPVMEKELASRAGVGWIGKNTCVIHPREGSFLLLGEVLTTLDLPVDDPAVDRCGSCTRCIDACPTGAITDAYQLDATRCISYLTIEHRGDIAAGMQRQMGDWIYGCDVCQDVCPWNRREATTDDPAFAPRHLSGTLPLDEVLAWSTDDYHRHTRRSVLRRVKLPVLQRNAAIARANVDRQCAPA
jgi:epoxyqueuosine reductase